MFVLNFLDTDSGLINSVQNKLQSSDLLGHTYSVYTKTKDFDIPCTNYKTNVIVLDLTDMLEDDLDIDDLMLSIIESNICPIVKLPKDEDFKEVFLECVDIYKIQYLNYEDMVLNNEPELDSLIDYTIIDEVFNGMTELNKFYSPNAFTTRFDITDETITVNGETLSIHTFNFEDMYNYIDTKKLITLNNADYFMSKYILSPIIISLIPTEDYVERINNYKMKVFNKAMQLTPREISNLPMEVANIYVKAGYVPMDKILEYKEELEKLL